RIRARAKQPSSASREAVSPVRFFPPIYPPSRGSPEKAAWGGSYRCTWESGGRPEAPLAHERRLLDPASERLDRLADRRGKPGAELLRIRLVVVLDSSKFDLALASPERVRGAMIVVE